MTECDLCGHPPIRHIQDGRSWYCLVCESLVRNGVRLNGLLATLCTQQMNFKLSEHERAQASIADKASYPPRTICAECFYEWEEHMGYLCPSGDSTFIPLLNAGQDYKEN